MEKELKKLPLRSVPDDYADRVMSHIAREQAKRRGALVALGAITLALMIGIAATLPEVVSDLFLWLGDPVASLAPLIAWEEEAISTFVLLALVLGIGLCASSALLLARLNEPWKGAAI